MNSSENKLFSQYLQSEKTSQGDWLRLGVMLALLVLARVSEPASPPAVVLGTQSLYPSAVQPVGSDSSKTNFYNVGLTLGRSSAH
jgi:hypothetical protein